MRYQYCPNNPDRYATNLLREQGTRNLTWESARGQDVLLVQTPFEQRADGLMEELCRLMEQFPPLPGKYTEIKPGVWVRFVTAADKARMNGCPINTEASTYSIFSCFTQEDVCSIYAQQENQAMISAYCSIPMQIHVDMWEQERTEGVLFKKRVVKTGYYIISFPQEFAAGYRDGDLACRVGELDIPVTKQMLEQGYVYLWTDRKPEIYSVNRGLELV